jgi:fluoroquinolone transport system permease protein
VRALAVVRALGPVDARSVARDSMLRWLLVLVPVFALALRFAVPGLTTWLETELRFDLVPYYALITSFVGMMAAGMVGTVIGFLLLDQRDDQTLPALLVTPMSLGDYLLYRLSVPTLLAVPLAILTYAIAALVPISTGQLAAAALTAAPLAVLYAVFIGSVATNKVQGLALVKGVGILWVPAVLAWFVPWPWQELAGVVPHYWPLKVFWEFDAGRPLSGWVHAALGVAVQGAWIAFFARRLARVTRR